MNRTRFVLLTLVTMLAIALGAAGQASAATTVIDARDDSPGSRWVPSDVTIAPGDTVRWEFDEALVQHNLKSSSANWSKSTELIPPDGPPVEHTFTTPGTYTFLCELHGNMTGSVTVADPNALNKVLVFWKTGGFVHSSIDEGVAAIKALGAANGFTVDDTNNANAFTATNLAQYDVVVFMSTTGEVLDDAQQTAFENYIQGGGGFAGVHAASDTEYSWPWYGELIGGYFRSHPPGTPNATVEIEDGDEPSTTGLPASWTRVDEWYNFQHPTTPAVNGNGTIADFSPRARGVKVLATVDEATYGEEDGNTIDDDHPVTWCSDFDGGRSWYTAMGHTEDSFANAQFRAHLLGGLRTAAGAGDCGPAREMPPVAADFEKVTLNNDTNAPMEIDIAPDGRAFYVELDGRVQMWSPGTRQTTTVGTIPVSLIHENGLMGIQLAPDFTLTGHIYVVYATPPDQDANGMGTNRISRFTLTGSSLGQEQVIYEWRHQRQECCHTGGSIDFGPDGSLYLSTGDNTNPFAHGFNPTDERAGRSAWDAQRTSANSKDPNGKVIRIKPIPGASGVQPGLGSTYTIPAGNMFGPGGKFPDADPTKTLPEIFAMGFRNPFRLHVDQKTGWVLLGDYGPDANAANPARGPQGSVEYNVVKEPGFYGWPYCIRQNVPYHDITYTSNAGGTDNGTYNCAAPVNDSPNNTGLTNLPPAQPATMWMAYSESDTRFPDLGTGGAPTGGPRYYYDEASTSTTKFPRFYDGQWFIGEWNNDWVKTATLNNEGLATGVACFAICSGYISPMDLEFGPNGSLYVVEWGQGFNENNADSGVYRIDYVQGERLPIASATASNDAVPVGTTVNFSSEGSRDPDQTPITFSWNFGDGTPVSTDANPSHTFTAAGTYQVTLTVTDASGASAVDTITVVVGNERPVVTIETPENGKVADFGDKVLYEVSVVDPDGGPNGTPVTIEQGSPGCANIRIEVKLGHDTHAHELTSTTGCSGSFTLTGVDGHGVDANVFTVITANYTDAGNGPAAGVTGSAEAILQPKLKQAEYWSTTGRLADSRATSGDPGIVNEAATDTGGGQSAAFIEDGDWISFNPYNLEDLDKVTFRVASAGAGGTIEFRLDDPASAPVFTSPMITPSGGWQTWKDVTVDLPDNLPDGTHRLFLVFRHPTATGSLMNLNWFKFTGKGAAVTAPPEVTATATPTSGEAPLDVEFDATATDAEGEAMTYAWDFGVPGTGDTSTQEDPEFRYTTPGNYTATVTVTDAAGAKSSASVEVRVTRPLNQCPTGPVRSDEFDGNTLDLDRWTVLRPDAANPLSVSDGKLNLPIGNGSMYGAGTTAKNLVVQPAPDGEWSATAKIETTGLTENYQQAGLRVWTDDDNWASVHMIFAGTGRDFEFIYENDGAPRNEAADKLGGIAAELPNTYYVRLTSDGTDLRASYSWDGVEFEPVGRPAPISSFGANMQIGPAALSDQAPTVPMARFDWIRFDPDGSTGGGEGIVDNFDGTELGAAWERIRGDQSAIVSGGTLQIPAQPGDLYQGRNDAKNLIVRDAPDGSWEAITKLNFKGTAQYHQAGIMVYGDDANFTKLGRISTNAAGAAATEKFEFINEVNGTARNAAQDSTANLPANFPTGFFLKLKSDGTNVTGEYSTDGTTWTPVGRAAALPANAKIGLFAFSNDGAGNPIAAFDSFSLTGENVGGGGGGGPVGPSYDDQFDGTSLDKTRWNAIVRDTPSEYAVAGGELTVTTSLGDIYTGDTNPPPNNFILQDASHAGEDWEIETKISGSTVSDGYGQGGLLAYADGDNYVKFDAVSDAGSQRLTRLELRSEVAGAITNPQENQPLTEAQAAGDIWLRLKKAGTSYTGEYSFDGTTWTAFPGGAVTNAMADPDFGILTLGPQATAVGETVSYDYFLLDGEDEGEPCGCVARGDEFEGSTLDTTRWNAIAHDDPSKYAVTNGGLQVTTTAGEIYQGSTGGGPLILQSADHAGTDFVLETKLSHTLDGGYSQGGILIYGSDNDYVKINAISDQNNATVNRLELRSESGGTIGPAGTDPTVPAGTANIWLRITKTGTTYSGEYSFNGTTWTPFGYTVTNAMVAPAFGLYTQGVQQAGDTVTFEYFSVDGKTGCEPPPPDNEAPVMGDVAATPSSGFAPLDVDFTAAATDADGDELTYSWDFDGDGTADANTANASHTYAEAGQYNAKVTVTDGEDSVSQTVPVSVLAADDPEARFRVLVFSKTAGFRHSSIDEGIAAIKALGEANDFQVDATEDASVFRDGVLSHFDTVVFLSTTGDVLNLSQQAAFERYIEAGGGYTGVHAASDTEYDWRWYGNLVGAYFRNHPANQTATVHVEDQEHPSTEGLPASYSRLDEWYNFKSPAFAEVGDADFSPRADVHVLATVDESTYNEDDGNATDDDHPVTWCQKYDGGRSWYTAMGHTEESYTEANFLQQLLGGIETTAGAKPSADCGIAPDVTAPTSKATLDPASPAAGPIKVTLEATDDTGGSGVAKLEYKVDGAAAWTTYSAPFTVSAEGKHTVTFRATDEAGNVEEAKSIALEIDRTAPTTTATLSPARPDKKTGAYKQPVQVTLAAGDGTGSGVARTEYRIDGGAWQTYAAPFTVTADGQHTVEYRSVDKAGNTEATKSTSFRIKKPGGFEPGA